MPVLGSDLPRADMAVGVDRVGPPLGRPTSPRACSGGSASAGAALREQELLASVIVRAGGTCVVTSLAHSEKKLGLGASEEVDSKAAHSAATQLA